MSGTVPTAIDNLVAALQAAPALSGVSVYDGPPTTAETPDWIAVGYDPATDSTVDFDLSWAQLGAQRLEESYDLLCTLASNSGDEGMSTRRRRAGALLDAVAAVVAADRTLGGAVRVAGVLGSGSYLQSQDGQGASVGIRFRVNCSARITN